LVPYPLAFRPILKERVWGGRGLEALGKRLPEGVLVGESWELADLPESVPEGRSIIANGDLAGTTLREAISGHRAAIAGQCALTPDGGFPLLLKYLDARENLSVQVHPDAAYVRRHPGTHLKSEAWVIVSAAPGAVIYKGLRPGVTAADFARHVRGGEVEGVLNAIAASPGDCHYLPAGTCHALGAGIIVAEIQTPSDTTFRVFDWGRDGRELHVEQALECITFGARPGRADRPGAVSRAGGVHSRRLLRTEHFTIERIETPGARAAVELGIETSGMPRAWMVLAGGGLIETPDAPTVALATGKTVLVPASLAGAVASLAPASHLLEIRPPPPALAA
jgi:mannose-6-phosphate isomerase